jgi:hypothetical protein
MTPLVWVGLCFRGAMCDCWQSRWRTGGSSHEEASEKSAREARSQGGKAEKQPVMALDPSAHHNVSATGVLQGSEIQGMSAHRLDQQLDAPKARLTSVLHPTPIRVQARSH